MKKFYPDSDYATHRDSHGGRWIIQNDRRFSIGEDHKYLGKVDGPDVAGAKEEKKEKKKERKRAAKKLAGFKEQQATGSIRTALDENKAAEAAEADAE